MIHRELNIIFKMNSSFLGGATSIFSINHGFLASQQPQLQYVNNPPRFAQSSSENKRQCETGTWEM
uniref:Putative ovule protein n=1 Tax=Solanum chacoense TaxID=4108 RepID=A0A0V0H131_SOLCH